MKKEESNPPLPDGKRTVLERVNSDPVACDLTISLFVAAVHSYRHDSVLRPFPPAFIKEGFEKDKKALEQAVKDIPSMAQLEPSFDSLPESTVNLLMWHFNNKYFTLKTRDKNDYYDILSLTESREPTSVEPSHVFEVLPSQLSQSKFEQLQQGRQILYAYHGSRVENFYSILHTGLASHMNKNGIFGEGTYLSSELSVSLHYSPAGLGWSKSWLGNRLSCVAVCEIIDDPSVKCQPKGDTELKRSRALLPNSIAGEVPEKYYVIRNNDVIRVKYLLVYADKPSNNKLRNRMSWFSQHKFALLMAFYFLLLVIIGLANSKQFKQNVKRLFKS
ncbi:protein mono-ADP-ribosyltransferase PARP16 isoform X1 [Octopus bimaculoides]|uniref:Poly [ADP-ribose] polymerase n=1 Tax=Octopus bimaculoides TaxID=37653 RepID=A0A0L8GEL2_OCTBM|nr:protein mono-ADP-ribosyltransferase PARP16 isoform X1 [Octopus bimaculoides]|eukprot:XP_014781742.1 PREDICTED: mono [ADP-ribose] polymerase PARP16-like [Octopus bimaculoides]